MFGQLVRQDRDEDEIVDPQHDFECDEREQGKPGGGIGKKRDNVHSARMPGFAAQRNRHAA
jgi:hypothetical protein